MIKKIAIVFINISLLLISCKENKQSNDGKSISDTTIENDESIFASQTEKLNILIDNFNTLSTSSYSVYDYYVKAFGDDKEIFKKITFYSTRQISDSYVKGLENLDRAIKINALPQLNPLIKDYKTKGTALAKIVNEAYTYYDMKDFESDSYQKGREFHKPLLAAFDEFFKADALLRKKSDSIQNISELAHLKELKEKGESLNYLIGMSLNTSKTMLEESQKVSYQKLDVKKLEAANKAVRRIFDEMTLFKNEKPGEFSKNHQVTFYYSSLKDYTKASNELYIRKKNKKAYSTGEKMNLNNVGSGWMVSGSVPQLLDKYNKLVDSYNRIVN